MFSRLLIVICLILSTAVVVFSQSIPTGSLAGTVKDQSGAYVANATVVVKNIGTNAEFTTQTSDNGTFTVPSLTQGVYTVTVSATGFKTTIAQNVKIDVAKTSNLEIALEVGQINESIVVASGAEVLRTTETSVSSTITGRQIVELPFATRDALQLVLVQPGTQTATVPRASTINGLPKGSLNITLDGINVQDNLLKSSDGFFTSTQAKADAVDEMTVSSATPGAESSAGGASQIRFVTKTGTNEFHGGAFWQHRNTALNANYYFNNIDGLARDRMLLNQFGGHVGGPIWKNHAFFFFNYEEFRLPQTYPAARTIVTDKARTGIFTYRDSTGVTRDINLLALAASRNPTLPGTVRPYATTIDPIVNNLLGAFSAGAADGGTLKSRVGTANDFNRLDLTFQAPGTNIRRFPTARFDWDVTKKHHFEFTYHYQQYFSDPDAVNGQLPVVPGAGIVLGAESNTTGSIKRNAFSFAGALRSTLSNSVVNEARYTLGNGGISIFGSEAVPALFGGRRGYTLTFPFGSNPQTRSTQSRRHTPVTTIYDNVTWIKGTHSYNFGGTFTHVKGYQQSQGSETIPGATFGIAAGDPVNTGATALFTSANFPNSSSGQRTDAANLYALLTGRVSSLTYRATLDDESKQFTFTPFEEQNYQNELGFFFQDSWRARPNLTLNYGVRWEIDFAPRNKNGVYTTAGYESVWGISGVGNLFNPKLIANSTLPQFRLVDENTKPYETRYNDFAPSFGFAWTPDFGSKGDLLKKVFGSAGQFVIRGGYSIAYVREGFDTFYSMWGLNPGPFLSLSVSPANNPAEFVSGGFSGPGSVLFRDATLPRRFPPSQATFPITAGPGEDFNEWSPNLRMGYVQSWAFGLQRELSRNMAIEIRYVGNHGTKLWRQYELNEVNIFENGFLDEFKIAQENLRLARLINPTSNNFGLQAGVPGTRPIPIISTALATSNDEAFATTIRRGLAGSLASSIALNNTRMGRLITANLVPFTTLSDGTKVSNFFVVNPQAAAGGSYLVTNDGHSTYNALQIELRRRLSKGLLIDGSYTFAKSLSNMFANSSSVFSQPTTLRDLDYDKGPSPFDLRQAFKINGIYELPIGPGRRWMNWQMPVVSKLLEGWQIGGVARIQSGTPLRITGGRTTFNNNIDGKDNGVVLHNLTTAQLQSMMQIRKDPSGVVYFLPQSLINNSLAAFEVAGAPTFDPTAPYIGPPTTPGELGARIFLYGPWQKKIDFNILKKTRITERVNMEFRAQFLNAFNYQNFFAGTVNSTNSPILADGGIGSQFGQTRSAYRDVTVSGTNDPGGRLIEFQLRFNF
ncbi:MAG TPA: carboxypeptidase regulatory-like domain-containing protein [Pyrinomonadaceae bacterium]|nr:carboxypeptidase regulatory-like domain-containing protein [Pyrinomonadaceae bacterium]